MKTLKSGEKVAQKQGAINFVAEHPKGNKALSKMSPRTGNINFFICSFVKLIDKKYFFDIMI